MKTTAAPTSASASDQPQRRPWLTVAAETMAALQTVPGGATRGSASDWLVDAARQAGYSLNIFRRQLRVAQFLRTKVLAERWQALLELNPPFSIVELMQRYFDADAAQAEALMDDALAGKVPYRDLLKRYQTAQALAGGGSGRKVHANRSNTFKQRAVDCLCEHSDLFMSAGDRTRWSLRLERGLPRFPYGKLDLVAIGHPIFAGEPEVAPFVDAFEVRLFGQDDSRQVVVRTLERVAMLQLFFRRIWLVYPSNEPEVKAHALHLDDVRTHLNALDMRTVGIITIAERLEKARPQIKLKPTSSDPLRHTQLLYRFVE